MLIMNKHTLAYLMLLIIAALLLTLVSCNPASEVINPPSSGNGLDDSDEVTEIDDGQESKEESEGEEQPSNQDEADLALAGDLLICPPPGQQLYLELDHAVTFNYEEMSLSHFLHQGMVYMDTLEGGQIGTSAPGNLKYSIEGVMSSECSINGEGQMTVTVQGICEDGVVRLKIDENWQALSGQMECIDEDGDVTIAPFNTPSAGRMSNHGPDGEGEVFLLTDAEGGYVVMRPFEQGQGYHTWTLYSTLVPTAPLVP
jgi:hypothetical protein